MPRDTAPITPETLLMAYASGVFPMAESRADPDIFWVDPERRGVMPLDGFRLSRSLAKLIRQNRFIVTLNEDFDGVVAGDTLAGGVYGVTLGAAFFGESMFSRRRNASKVALAYLVTLLNAHGFKLFDTQFLTEHLASLGAIEISRGQYHIRLKDALSKKAKLTGPVPQFPAVMHLRSQTS